MEEIIGSTIRRLREATARAAERTEKMEAFRHVASQESLIALVGQKLKDRKLILVSNREPYAHVYQNNEITWYRSAGGLTIALDSMAAACRAVWVCRGDGDADFAVTDGRGRVGVPPGRSLYTLKRIRLTPEEELGYYEGFSNETLWPLCHVCYVRPKFVQKNWEIYQQVNRKFADAILEEAEPGSIIFLQDYHLCLVAQYLKEARPDLTSVMFWHIPWPNPEIFRILPWKQELLTGLLANDILGFHLYYHARNFMETVGLEMEARLDWEKTQVIRKESATRIRSYPISIDFHAVYRQAEQSATLAAVETLQAQFRLAGLKVGVGVDRIDYTKGILERLDAVEYLLTAHPEHCRQFTFLQIGVPSRAHLEDYQAVIARIESRCQEINDAFGDAEWKPVIFLKGHRNFDTLVPFYKMADVCVVSSLHDGMNLVAKEFVAASSNDRGALVLSRFTGASRELEQALMVNPYDITGLAEALHAALTMPPEEQRWRLERMRLAVAENNIYTWAESILGDVVKLAEDNAAPPAAGTAGA